MEVYDRVFVLISISTHIHGRSIIDGISGNILNSIKLNTSDSELSANTAQLIWARGFTAREYRVTTKDGYILTVNRIKNLGPAVFLMHGLIGSADDWLTLGDDAFPFQLARAGYDVFLGNARGNKYSREHITLSPKERAFWNFTFHEIGFYDLPAMIDFALEISNKSKLAYVGQSQGTTAFYVMASLKPSYNGKVSVMVSMATVAWFYHVKTPVLRALVPLRYQEEFLAEVLGFYDILSYDTFWRFVTTRVCPFNRLTLLTCVTVLFSVYGFDYEQLDYDRLPAEIGHMPAGASIKQLLHFAQLIDSHEFRQFDYKFDNLNRIRYGSGIPPSYPVEHVTAPILIMYGDNDALSSLRDVQILISKLPNVIDIYRVPYPKFNHMDFLFAKNANTLVYSKIIEYIKQYNRKI